MPHRDAAVPEIRASPVSGFSWKNVPRRERAREASDVEVVQEPAMREAVEARRAGVLVGHGPADVVVAPDVRRPGRSARRALEAREREGHQGSAALGEAAPASTISWLL